MTVLEYLNSMEAFGQLSRQYKNGMLPEVFVKHREIYFRYDLHMRSSGADRPVSIRKTAEDLECDEKTVGRAIKLMSTLMID